jgi:hypothetical protein
MELQAWIPAAAISLQGASMKIESFETLGGGDMAGTVAADAIPVLCIEACCDACSCDACCCDGCCCCCA